MNRPDPTVARLAAGAVLMAYAGPLVPDWVLQRAEAGAAGVVLFGDNVVDPGALAEQTARLAQARGDLVVAVDEEGGDVTRLEHRRGSSTPGNAALGAADSLDLTWQTHAEIGRALAAVGCTLDLAPCLDVNTAAANPVIGTRSFGADPQLVARHGVAATEGLQAQGVAACVKHFPGHGATTVDSHLGLPTIDAGADVLRHRDLVPFEAAVAAGAAAVMTAHIRIPDLTGDLPATLSAAVLRDLLRGELGFEGVIVTDALDMRGVSADIGIPEAACRSLAAGADLLCVSATMDAGQYDELLAALVAACEQGRVSPDALERSGERVRAMTAAGRDLRDVVEAPPHTVSSGVGAEAARRALRVEGELPTALRHPVVLMVETLFTIAQGRVAWGLEPFLPPGAEGLRLDAAEASTDDLGAVLGRARDRGLVVVVRDAHRQPRVQALVTRLLAARADLVLVDLGLPLWRPEGVVHVGAHSASRASARAVADLVLGQEDAG